MTNSNLSVVTTTNAVLPSATDTVLGGVMVQSDSGILVDDSGNISVDNTQFLEVSTAASEYLPLSGGTVTGTLLVPTVASGDSSDNAASTEFVMNAISGGGSSYVLPPATSTALGGVMVQSGSGLEVDGSGDISVDNTQFLSVSNAENLYEQIGSIQWETISSTGQTLTVNGGVSCLFVSVTISSLITLTINLPDASQDSVQSEIQIIVLGIKPGSGISYSSASSGVIIQTPDIASGPNSLYSQRFMHLPGSYWFQIG